jgi:hypothetical protein
MSRGGKITQRAPVFIHEGSAMIAAEPGKPADFTLYEEFLSWIWPLFL